MAALTPRLVTALTRASSALSLNAQRTLGRWLGRVAWYARAEPARTTRINLRACFPDWSPEARRSVGRRSLEHTGETLMETGVVFHWPDAQWRLLEQQVEGAALFDRARAEGRGVLILAPHFGNWEFLALTLGRYRVTALYDPPRLAALEPLIRRARSRTGSQLLPIDAHGLRGFYHALASGGVTALLPDQVPERSSGVYADFFGQPALTMTFAHRLVRRFDPLVVLGSASRCAGGFRIRFKELGPDVRDADPAIAARAINRAIEDLIRTDPAQYQWEYKRFKGQPPGYPRLYVRRRR
ncbi:MAG: lysophospholipid acyltransferase family protein [Pseudomonadota bacterium]